MSKQPKHILAIRFSAMGDVAMTVPVLRAVKQQNPEVKITVLTKAPLAPIFDIVPDVNVVIADLKGEHKGIYGLYKLSKKVNNLSIDAVADLHNVLRTHILKFFIRSRPFVRIDKGRKEKAQLVQGKRFEQLKTTHERYADVFRKLNVSVDLSQPTFPEKLGLSSETKNLIGNQGKIIGIAPFAAFKGKAYPIDQMSQVIDALNSTHKVLLFGGGKNEKQQLDDLASRKQNVVSLAGILPLKDELAVISNLELMVSMDSGNAHLAAMMGVKVITLWGVTHPYAGFYPFNQDPNFALLADREVYPKIPTSIYGNKQPEGYEHAIGTISPEQVVDKIKQVLDLPN